MFYGIFYLLSLNFTSMSCVKESVDFNTKDNFLFVNPVTFNRTNLSRHKRIHATDYEVEPLAREEFPLLNKDTPELKDLIFFNNSTTTHKPESVLKTEYDYYTNNNFSVYRGSGTSHDELSTQIYENSRHKVSSFINASSPSEIIFTSGVTESVNLVANTWGPVNLKRDDVILLPYSEHNSDLLPWRKLCEMVGCKVKYVKLLSTGKVDLDDLEFLLKTTNAKLLCCGHASNVLGIIQDIKKISRLSHDHGCVMLVDAAQTAGKIKIDVQDLDVDFLAASGHKMYAPTGVGFLYYKKHLLEKLEPHKVGGGAVKDVSLDSCEYLEAPYRFEAGTPPVSQAIGLGAAIDFLNRVGMDKIRDHDKRLLNYLYQRIKNLVKLYNFDITIDRLPIIAFNVEGVDPFDLCTMLATRNIITRSGKHCAYLIHKTFYHTNTIRVSLSIYNSSKEVDKFIEILKDCISKLKQ